MTDAADARLTPEQAAELLNVSTGYLIGLLNRGAIPTSTEGIDRWVKPADLLAYQRARDLDRRQRLDRLTRKSQELGLYSSAREREGR